MIFALQRGKEEALVLDSRYTSIENKREKIYPRTPNACMIYYMYLYKTYGGDAYGAITGHLIYRPH